MSCRSKHIAMNRRHCLLPYSCVTYLINLQTYLHCSFLPTAGITGNTCRFYGIYLGIFPVRQAGKYAQEMYEVGGRNVSRDSKIAKKRPLASSRSWVPLEGFSSFLKLSIFAKHVEKIQVPLKSDKPNGYFKPSSS